MTSVAVLRADCARCVGLCCVALAFDRSPLFGFDKPAGMPCPNLNRHDRCTIHAGLSQSGFAGCAAYDCLGAGQRATALFTGRSWRDSQDMARAMFNAFRALRLVHELLGLLASAETLPLSAEQEQQRTEFWDRLTIDWTAKRLSAFEHGPLPHSIRGFLRSLRDSIVEKSAAETGTTANQNVVL